MYNPTRTFMIAKTLVLAKTFDRYRVEKLRDDGKLTKSGDRIPGWGIYMGDRSSSP